MNKFLWYVGLLDFYGKISFGPRGPLPPPRWGPRKFYVNDTRDTEAPGNMKFGGHVAPLDF